MKRVWQLSYSVALVLLASALTRNCSAAQQTTERGSLTRIRAAYVSPLAGTGLPHMVAKDKGWFAEERLDPTVIYTYDGLPGLLGGSLDIVAESADDGLFARKQGENLIVVDVIQGKAESGYFVTRPEITSIKQVKGKTLGVPDIPSGVYLLTIKLLSLHGLAKDDATWRKVGSVPARVGALQKGLIDGSILNTLGWINAQKLGSFNLLASPKDLGPFPWQMLILKSEWARANEKALVGYLRAIERAKRWILDPANEDEAVQVYLRQLPSGVKMDEKTGRALIKGQRDNELFDLSPLTPAELLPVVEQMELGGGRGPFDVKGFVDMSYYHKAMGKR